MISTGFDRIHRMARDPFPAAKLRLSPLVLGSQHPESIPQRAAQTDSAVHLEQCKATLSICRAEPATEAPWPHPTPADRTANSAGIYTWLHSDTGLECHPGTVAAKDAGGTRALTRSAAPPVDQPAWPGAPASRSRRFRQLPTVTRSLAIFLFGVSPFDPVTFGAVSL